MAHVQLVCSIFRQTNRYRFAVFVFFVGIICLRYSSLYRDINGEVIPKLKRILNSSNEKAIPHNIHHQQSQIVTEKQEGDDAKHASALDPRTNQPNPTITQTNSTRRLQIV